MVPAPFRPSALERPGVAALAALAGMASLCLAQAPDGRSACLAVSGCAVSCAAIALTFRARPGESVHRGAILAPFGFVAGCVVATLVLVGGLGVGLTPGCHIEDPTAPILVTLFLAMPLVASLLGLMLPSSDPAVRHAASATWLTAAGALSLWCATHGPLRATCEATCERVDDAAPRMRWAVSCEQLAPPFTKWVGLGTLLAGLVLAVFAVVRALRQRRWLRAVANGDIGAMRVRVSDGGDQVIEQYVEPTYRVAPGWEAAASLPSRRLVLTTLCEQLAIALGTLVGMAALAAVFALGLLMFFPR